MPSGIKAGDGYIFIRESMPEVMKPRLKSSLRVSFRSRGKPPIFFSHANSAALGLAVWTHTVYTYIVMPFRVPRTQELY